MAVCWQGRILVIRTSYRPILELPAGGIGPGESPREAALRELREETGLDAPPEALEGPLRLEFQSEHRHITEQLFMWHPAARPEPRVNRREVVAAMFMTPEELRGQALAPNLALFLERGEDRGAARG